MRRELFDCRDVVCAQQMWQHQRGAESVGEGIVRAGNHDAVARGDIFEFV